MSERKKISEIVIENPKINIKKGTMLDYVPMEQVLPNERYVRAAQQRAYNGGAKFQDGDTIFARITPCLQNRKIAQYKSTTGLPASGSTEYFVFRAIPDVSDSSYIYYLIKSDLVVETAINSMKGASGRQRAEMQPILNIKMDIPEYGTQIKIGSILSMYDNLIENNNRRIAILEEMAQRLYREWFVHFRFPGHEDVEMVDSELGMIPEGWKIKNLFECADVQYGYAFKSKTFTEDRSLNPVVRIRDILGNETNTFTPEEPDGKYLLENGDILIGMDGIFHMNQWAGGKAYLNQRVVRIRSINVPMLQLFYSLQPVIKQLETTISGTTVAHLSDSDLKKISVLLPDVQIQERATRLFDVILSEKILLIQRNRNLRKTRDHLLPRLISGDINVSKIEI